MRTGRTCAAILATALATALLVPTAAMANGFFVERGLLGLSFSPPTYSSPVISGDNIIFGSLASAPGSTWILSRFNIATGATTAFHSHATDSAYYPRVSGDWVVWQQNTDIKAKNIKTGAFKNVTNDGATTLEWSPAVSGSLVVWWSWNGSNWDLMWKDLATTAAPKLLAGGAGNQEEPSIYGKRVAYLDDSNGHSNVYVTTIGSSAAPIKITNNAVTQWSPGLGDHLVAWLVNNSDGQAMIRYFDFNTGEIHDGPTDSSHSVGTLRVSGDRILYDISNGSNQDLYVWDTRIAKTSGIFSLIGLSATSANEYASGFSGNELTYMSDNAMYWGRLAVPSISLKAVPTRIARGGHIHLTGSISDQGHRIGGASIGIEKHVSGRWTRVKTLTASSTGTFSYQTPKINSKTQYRVVYDGKLIFFGAPVLDHLSTVSGTKTAWPR